MGGNSSAPYVNECESSFVVGGGVAGDPEYGLPGLTVNLIIDLACSGVGLVALTLLMWDRHFNTPAPKTVGAAVGVGIRAGPILEFMGMMNMCFSFTPVVLYYVFSALHVRPDLLCQIQNEGFGIPVWGIFFSLFSLLLLSAPALMRANRHAAAAALHILPEEHVLAMPVGRGLTLGPMARRLTTGTITGADGWGTAWEPESDAWCRENLRRDGAESNVRLVPLESFERLPFADGSFDVVAANMMLSMQYFNRQKDDTVLKIVRRRAVIAELVRVLRPGGRLVGMDLTWRLGTFLKELEEEGFLSVTKNSKYHFMSAFPVQTFSAIKPGVPEATVNRMPPVQGREGEVTHHEPAKAFAGTPHRYLRMSALVLLVGIWIGLLAIINGLWDQVQIPASITWGNQVGAVLLSNARIYTISIYYCYLTLKSYVQDEDRSTGDVAALIARILWNTLLGLTVWSAVTWLPFFALDMVLSRMVSLDTMSSINTYFGIAFYFVLIRFGIYYSNKKTQQQLDQMKAADEAAKPLLTEGADV